VKQALPLILNLCFMHNIMMHSRKNRGLIPFAWWYTWNIVLLVWFFSLVLLMYGHGLLQSAYCSFFLTRKHRISLLIGSRHITGYQIIYKVWDLTHEHT